MLLPMTAPEHQTILLKAAELPHARPLFRIPVFVTLKKYPPQYTTIQCAPPPERCGLFRQLMAFAIRHIASVTRHQRRLVNGRRRQRRRHCH